MKINEDCIRDTLEYLVENLTLKIKDNKGRFDSLSLLSIMKAFDGKYTKDDIWYSIYNLSQDRFIETNDVRKQSLNGFAFVEIYNVTHRGHQFFGTIQPQPLWDKTKSVVTKIGVHTLAFIEGVAHDIAVESAKQAVSITMMQK